MNKKQLLMSHLIKDFIKDKKRSPSQRELDFMYNEYLIAHPKFNKVGLNGSKRPEFKQMVNSESSASNFNKTIDHCLSEQNFVNNKLSEIDNETEKEFRMYANKFNESLKHIKKMEREINKNLLLHAKDDIYTHGLVETFEDYENINFDQSNIYMFNGKVTLGYTKVTGERFNSANLSYSVSSRSGRSVMQRNINDISNAVNEDGNFFKVLVFSKVPDDSIDFYIDLTFSEARHIDTLKFTTQAIESNSKIFYNCYYSEDDTTLNEVFESNLAIDNNENYVEINKDSIKSIRLVLNKRGYDYLDGEDYVYIFDLDFMGGTTKKFKINEESVLNLGPYKIKDADEEEVNFSMATIKGGTCCIVPDRTSIDFYLSKDNETWIKADYNNTGREVIQFEESKEPFDGSGLFKRYDTILSSLPLQDVIEDDSKIALDLLPHQRLLNLYILKENFKNIVKESMVIKRNVCNKGNKETYGAKEGWYRDANGYYCCLINIKEAEGRYLNFGEKSCFINDKQVSGKHFLTFGEHKFKTSEENWYDLDMNNESELNNEAQLREEDILYPYNHKYIIEGFNYSNIFNGKKVYLAKSEVYSFSLNEVSNQRFLIGRDLNNFTFINSEFTNDDGDIIEAVFIMVNAKEDSSEIKMEDYKLECIKRNSTNGDSSNELYIKAILKSSDPSVTPKIDQIQVRVI